MATAAASCTFLHGRSFFSIYVKSMACLVFNDADASLASVASKPAHRYMLLHRYMMRRVQGDHVWSTAHIGSGSAQFRLLLDNQAHRLKWAPSRLQLAPTRLQWRHRLMHKVHRLNTAPNRPKWASFRL